MPRDSRSCVLCDGGDDEGLVLLCEICDKPVHAHCAWASPAQSKAIGCAVNVRTNRRIRTPQATRAERRLPQATRTVATNGGYRTVRLRGLARASA